jgi:hypothetical protein
MKKTRKPHRGPAFSGLEAGEEFLDREVRILNRNISQRISRICMGVVVLFVLCAAAGNVAAYTYTYRNGTDYPIRVIAQFYDDTDKTSRIEPKGKESMSTPSLLKTWTAEFFFDAKWTQVLYLTCDFLPGDHNFSIYAKEMKDANGRPGLSWGVVDGTIEQAE